MGKKICYRQDEKHQGWYKVGNEYRCQYCDGIILDDNYIKKILQTPSIPKTNPCFNIDCYFHTFSNQCAQISSEDGPAFCPKRIIRIESDISVVRAYKTKDGNIFETEDDAKQYLLSNRIFKIQELNSDFEKWFSEGSYKFFRELTIEQLPLWVMSSKFMEWITENREKILDFIERINELKGECDE